MVNIIGSLILQHRERLDLKQKALANMVDCSDAYITKLEKGESIPSLEIAAKLEKALEIEGNLLVKEVMKSKMGEENFDIYSANVLKDQRVKFLDNSKVERVPLLGSVPAGREWTNDDVEEWFHVPYEITKGKKMYFVKAKGDCMIPTIKSGQIVLVNAENLSPVDGDIVVAIVDGEWTLKRFYRKNGTILLQPDNQAHQTIVVTEKNEITLRGVVHGIFPKGI